VAVEGDGCKWVQVTKPALALGCDRDARRGRRPLEQHTGCGYPGRGDLAGIGVDGRAPRVVIGDQVIGPVEGHRRLQITADSGELLPAPLLFMSLHPEQCCRSGLLEGRDVFGCYLEVNADTKLPTSAVTGLRCWYLEGPARTQVVMR
jgi:hypothetical protein